MKTIKFLQESFETKERTRRKLYFQFKYRFR
jgi:hypothetical protein